MVHGRIPEPDDCLIGCVVDISWCTTRLQTAENCVIIVFSRDHFYGKTQSCRRRPTTSQLLSVGSR